MVHHNRYMKNKYLYPDKFCRSKDQKYNFTRQFKHEKQKVILF